ncbi:MAG: DUF427 domain-containing protein [Woeseiaceae bacterium]|nr:DUF427 domain-containing protein [Woeseiaceae bacterium]
MWKNTGASRPENAVAPGPGQESVWDYPRPPALQHDSRLVEVKDGDIVIASTSAALRILETASPPTFYLPGNDVDMDRLVEATGTSVCEWKGRAVYWALDRAPDAPVAWSYPRPRARFEKIRDTIAFYPGRIECYVDGERVTAQAGGFYGGWITSEVVGPFKGEPGTGHW